MSFKIEKAIPLPAIKKPNQCREMLELMEIDDSFLIKCKDELKEAMQHVMCNEISSYTYGIKAIGKGKKFTTRRVKEGVRCWRIK